MIINQMRNCHLLYIPVIICLLISVFYFFEVSKATERRLDFANSALSAYHESLKICVGKKVGVANDNMVICKHNEWDNKPYACFLLSHMLDD